MASFSLGIVLENPVCTLGLVVTSVQVTLDQDPGSSPFHMLIMVGIRLAFAGFK